MCRRGAWGKDYVLARVASMRGRAFLPQGQRPTTASVGRPSRRSTSRAVPPDQVEEEIEIDRLGHAPGESPECCVGRRARIGSEEYDGNRRKCGVSTQLSHETRPAHGCHVPVEQDERGNG